MRSFIQLENKKRVFIALKEITLAGLMVATIEVAKAALSFLPNVELTSFLLIMYTVVFGKITFLVVPAFILIEGAIYGFNLWWIMYLYAWPLLIILTLMLRKKESLWVCTILSGAFGLLFGALCAIPYFFIGFINGSFKNGVMMAVSWWIAGIPWDIVHCIGNFTLMLVLYRPVRTALKHCKKIFF